MIACTPHEAARFHREIRKCRSSPAYFLDTYGHIYDAVSGAWVPFRLWPASSYRGENGSLNIPAPPRTTGRCSGIEFTRGAWRTFRRHADPHHVTKMAYDSVSNVTGVTNPRGYTERKAASRRRFSSLASFRPSLTSPSQGICCHLFAAAGGLIVVAKLANSAGFGKDFLAPADTWAGRCRAGITRTATQSNRPAPKLKLVRDMILSSLAGRLIVGSLLAIRANARLSCRGRLQGPASLENQDGGPGQIQPLVRRVFRRFPLISETIPSRERLSSHSPRSAV